LLKTMYLRINGDVRQPINRPVQKKIKNIEKRG